MKPDAIVHHQPSHCLNCGAHAPASFCQHCGQETHVHVPGAGEYLHEFIGHFVALENKLWKTLVLLLFKPGRLTRDYIDGKRVRYVLPLRLYLTLSLVFFAVFKSVGHINDAETSRPLTRAEMKAELAKESADLASSQAELDEGRKAAGQSGAAGFERAQRSIDEARRKNEAKAAALDGADAAPVAKSGSDNKLSIKLFGKDENSGLMKYLSPRLREKYDAFKAKPGNEQWHQIQEGLLHYSPYAIFAMMPFFALYLKLLYLGSGRRYGEHLLFALHTNAFAFLTLTLMMVLPSVPYLHAGLGLWLTFYLPTAMRKVYGGSRKATFVRWIVLMFLHLLGMVGALVAAFAMAVLG